jgi:large subunit ribosomal protein L4
MKVEVKNLNNKKVGDIQLSSDVFGASARPDILTRMVRWQLARRRQGTHKTKGMGEVSGSTRKPFRQKGTGRARQGSSRSPQQRGGAVTFGPVVRSHAHKLPKKVRKLALKIALSAKNADKKLMVIDSIKLKSPKTKDLETQFQNLMVGSVLVVDGAQIDESFIRASGNIVGVKVLPQQGINVYDILNHETLILTKEAVEYMEKRLK